MAQQQIRYPDSILTDSGRMVRVNDLNPNTKIRVHGHSISVKDIPFVRALLECSHIISGIALVEGSLVWCEKDQDEVRVAKINPR